MRSLQWRHNGHDSVSNHQPHDCLLNRLFVRRSKKTSKLRVTGLCVGIHRAPVNSPHKWPVSRKMFPFDDVIMYCAGYFVLCWAGIIHNWLPNYRDCQYATCVRSSVHQQEDLEQYHGFQCCILVTIWQCSFLSYDFNNGTATNMCVFNATPRFQEVTKHCPGFIWTKHMSPLDRQRDQLHLYITKHPSCRDIEIMTLDIIP